MADDPSTDPNSPVNRLYSPEAIRQREELRTQLLHNVRSRRDHIAGLRLLLDEWEEEVVYRFYHQSYKVFGAQSLISKAFAELDSLAPEGTELNDMFARIILDAISKKFVPETTNPNWPQETRPLVEALWHCKHMLALLTQFAELDEIPEPLPDGVATVLELYFLR